MNPNAVQIYAATKAATERMCGYTPEQLEELSATAHRIIIGKPPIEFRVGDWWLIEWGREYERFYIAETVGDKVRLCLPEYLACSGHWKSRDDLAKMNPEFYGHGRLKWYWRFLPWRDQVCPYYLPQ